MQEGQDKYLEIDLLQLLKVLWRRAVPIAASAVACSAVFFLVSQFVITPKYSASAMMYINNSRTTAQTESINSSDITASQSLVTTCKAILESRAVYDAVKRDTGIEYSFGEMSDIVSASPVNGTELMNVTAVCTDPKEAADIANSYMTVTAGMMTETVSGSSTKIVDRATVPVNPVSPNKAKNTLIGFMLGMLAAMGAVILLELFNKIIRSEKELNEAVDYVPVIGVIPDFETLRKNASRKGAGYGNYGDYYGGYGYGSAQRRNDSGPAGETGSASAGAGAYAGVQETDPSVNDGLLTGNMPFVFKEAYKVLRTNVMFSLALGERGRIIGVTSAEKGDGKSTSAVNIALSIAETGKRVLFLDCDMRLSMVAERLSLKKTPGLSNILVGASALEEALQSLDSGSGAGMDVITAGEFPPNPAELLSSEQMKALLDRLSGMYDYIIADLPPVQIVSDALILSELTDGFVFVVREGKSEREDVRSSVRKIEFVNGKILGFILANHYEKPKTGRYGKYGKYGHYGSYTESMTGQQKSKKSD